MISGTVIKKSVYSKKSLGLHIKYLWIFFDSWNKHFSFVRLKIEKLYLKKQYSNQTKVKETRLEANKYMSEIKEKKTSSMLTKAIGKLSSTACVRCFSNLRKHEIIFLNMLINDLGVGMILKGTGTVFPLRIDSMYNLERENFHSISELCYKTNRANLKYKKWFVLNRDSKIPICVHKTWSSWQSACSKAWS